MCKLVIASLYDFGCAQVDGTGDTSCMSSDRFDS